VTIFVNIVKLFEANARTTPRLQHGSFLLNPLEFIIHLSPYHLALYSLATYKAAEVPRRRTKRKEKENRKERSKEGKETPGGRGQRSTTDRISSSR
jgi:hypothetical protein